MFSIPHSLFVLPSTMRLALLLWFVCVGCDHGLVPPDEAPVGSIQGTITYVDLASWPPLDSLIDLRFFALPFVPKDTLDLFRDLNSLVFSERLDWYVASDTFAVDSVQAQTYIYSGVAIQFTRNLLDWRPIGLYQETSGFFQVRPGEVTELAIIVDFKNLPPFPPNPRQ